MIPADFRMRLPSALLLGALAGAAQAQPLHRCIGAHGEPTFSDQPCPPPDSRAAANLPSAPTVASATVPGSCASSPEELRDQVAAAFAAHDAIRLSGLFLWGDYRSAATVNALRNIDGLVRAPLASIGIETPPSASEAAEHAHATTPAAATVDASAGEDRAQLVIRTGRDMQRVPQLVETRFTLSDRGGCWWLQP